MRGSFGLFKTKQFFLLPFQGYDCLKILQVVQVAVKNKEKVDDQSNRSYDSEIESFRALAGEPDAESLKNLIDQITSGAIESISPIVLSPSSDKVHRTVSVFVLFSTVCHK